MTGAATIGASGAGHVDFRASWTLGPRSIVIGVGKGEAAGCDGVRRRLKSPQKLPDLATVPRNGSRSVGCRKRLRCGHRGRRQLLRDHHHRRSLDRGGRRRDSGGRLRDGRRVIGIAGGRAHRSARLHLALRLRRRCRFMERIDAIVPVALGRLRGAGRARLIGRARSIGRLLRRAAGRDRRHRHRFALALIVVGQLLVDGSLRRGWPRAGSARSRRRPRSDGRRPGPEQLDRSRRSAACNREAVDCRGDRVLRAAVARAILAAAVRPAAWPEPCCVLRTASFRPVAPRRNRPG